VTGPVVGPTSAEPGADAASVIGIRSEIVLIGPIRAGKSTIAAILAERLGVPQVSLDELCRDYFQELDSGEQNRRGPDGMIAWRYNAHAVKRMLWDHHDCVFDLGAGHSVYREPEALEQVREVMRPFVNVVLLLPCPDLEVAARILEERNVGNAWLHRFRAEKGYDPNAHFLRHPSNASLAKYTVYTEGRSPDETATDVARLAASVKQDDPASEPGSARTF
jgi:shikimate kinase